MSSDLSEASTSTPKSDLLQVDPQSPEGSGKKDTCIKCRNRRPVAMDLERAYMTGIFNSKEAAYLLGISVKTLYNWKLCGKFRVIKVNDSKTFRIKREELERLMGGRIWIRKPEYQSSL